MAPLAIRAVIVTAFEPDAGTVPGEFTLWRERGGLTERLPLEGAYRPLYTDGKGSLGLVAGVGAVRAAASVMALGLDARFDLTAAFFLVAGVCGIDPARGSLGSVVLPEWVVDGNFAHELDAREIPGEWPDGFVPIGKSTPYERPCESRFNGDDGIVFRLDAEHVRRAYEFARDTPLLDTEPMQARRVQFEPAATAHRPPGVLRGDELSATTFFHGKRMSERARRWVDYQTDGRGVYAITAMEDTGILQSLSWLAQAGRVDLGRVVIVRGASNFDQQRTGVSAAESLAETKVVTYSAYRPALENVYRVGSRILHTLAARD